MWTGAARLIRSEALSLRTRDFITASKALGRQRRQSGLQAYDPLCYLLVIVMATLSIPGVIMSEAALSLSGWAIP